MIRLLTQPGPARRALVTGLLLLLALGLFLWWRDAPPPTPPLLSLLPRGSIVTSQARVDLDGGRPFEIAATLYIPASPGADADLGHAVLAGYDRWRHRWRILFLSPLPGLPMTLEVGALLSRRDVVVFPAYEADGMVSYRVVALRWGRAVVLHAGRTRGRVEVTRGVLVERDPQGARGLRWDGRAFRPAAAPPALPPPLVWRYWYDRQGTVRAETTSVAVVPGQLVRLARIGGGPIVGIIPDPNLDQLSGGFRARRPGAYTITIPDFSGGDVPFRLFIQVADDRP